MSTPNPLYDPEWEVKHGEHDERRWYYLALARSLPFDSPERDEATKQNAFHDAECKRLLRCQHRTVEDYADWLFTFVVDDGTAYVAPDRGKFTSIEAVLAEWRRVKEEIERNCPDYNSLPRGQPKGLRAFGERGTSVSSWRTFSAESLGDVFGARYQLKCIVTFDEIDGTFHICLSFNRDGQGPGVINRFEHIATILRGEILASSAQGGKPSLLDRLLKRAEAASHDRSFVFYLFTPGGPFTRESFEVVGLKWTEKGYADPQWAMVSFSSVPSSIADAAFNLAVPGISQRRRLAS